MTINTNSNIEKIVLGGGCFWCIEAVFEKINGVIKVESGYAGGNKINPSYKDVTKGLTNHAEVCKITYDKTVIDLKEILDIFYVAHGFKNLCQNLGIIFANLVQNAILCKFTDRSQ